MENIYNDIPEDLPEELFETLLANGAYKIERIVSRGHATPHGRWYDQETDEWVILLKGGAGLKLAGQVETVVMAPGDYLFLPAHLKHRVEWTDREKETVWLAVHQQQAAG